MPERTRHSRGFVHPKWRIVRPQIPVVHAVADIVADPVLRDQILSTIDPPIDFAGLCRAIDPEVFADLAAGCVPEPVGFEDLPVSSHHPLSEKAASIIHYVLRLRHLASPLEPGPVVEIAAELACWPSSCSTPAWPPSTTLSSRPR